MSSLGFNAAICSELGEVIKREGEKKNNVPFITEWISFTYPNHLLLNSSSRHSFIIKHHDQSCRLITWIDPRTCLSTGYFIIQSLAEWLIHFSIISKFILTLYQMLCVFMDRQETCIARPRVLLIKKHLFPISFVLAVPVVLIIFTHVCLVSGFVHHWNKRHTCHGSCFSLIFTSVI